MTLTKTAPDLNGGDLEIVDVVRGTMTLTESSVNPAEYAMADGIALQLGDLAVQAIRAGATDNGVLARGENRTR